MTARSAEVPPADEAARIGAFCARHELPGLVDVHTHFMPERVLTKVWAFFDQLTEHPEHGPMRWPISYRHDEARRLEILRSFGVRRFTSLLYPHKPQMAAWLNDWATDFARRTPDCAHSATFYPEESAADYVAKALAEGAVIFKAHVQVGGYDPLDPLLDKVWGQLADSGTPTVIHCGNGPNRGRHTGPEPIAELLRRHPRLPLVIAHAGMPEYADFLALVEKNEHVWLDTTMVFTDFTERLMPFPTELLPRLADRGDRVVLGTDFPNIPYPYLHQLEALERLELGGGWFRRVCWDNGVRLIGAP